MRKIALFLSMTASVMLASCSMESLSKNEPVVNPPVNGGNQEDVDTQINLTIPGGFSVMSTRGLTTEQESAIEDAYVLVFSAEDNDIEAIIEVESTKIKVVEEATTLGMKLPEGSHRLVVIANAAALVESELGIDVTAITDKGYADVVGKLTQTVSGKMFDTGGAIPMWGETEEPITITKSTKVDIDLVRSIARVDVGVGKFEDGAWDDMDIPFELTEVYMMRPLSGYRVVPDMAKFAADPREPSVPSPAPDRVSVDDSVVEFKFTENIIDGAYLAQEIYVPETPVDGDVHTEQMALVVGGKYRGGDDVTYYRLDFAGTDETLVDVLRNHLYRFQITSVISAGYEYPAVAYNAVGEARMTATILDWDEVPFDDLEIVGDGYISTSGALGGVKMSVLANETKTITIRTNLYDLELSVGGNVVLTGAAAEAAGTTGQTYSTEHFKYTLRRVVGSQTDWTLETAALSYNIGMSGAARTDEWTVTAGDGLVDLDFTVTQPFAIAPSYVPNPAGEVAIDGPLGTLVWSLSNVDAPRVFAAGATDYGRLYQFASAASPTGTRMVGWTGASDTRTLADMGTAAGINASGAGVAWDASIHYPDTWSPVGDWLAEANPCPTGWRVPTQTEWQAFYTGTGGTTASSTWGANGGINGRTFTVSSGPDANKTIFLPAAGSRFGTAGPLTFQVSYGFYWSTSAVSDSTTGASYLLFYNSVVDPANANDTRVAYSVRCVRNVGGTAAATYSVSANATAGGTASIVGATTVAAGQFARVSATVNDRYSFTGWTSSDITISAADATKTTLDFTMPKKAVTVTANFEEIYAFSPAGEFRIGDLIWAGSNVDAPGTFAANSYDYGRLYQFASAASPAGTRLVGWSSDAAALNTMGTSAGIDKDGNGVAWDTSYNTSWDATGDWLPEADPCPTGWRVPAKDEWAAFYTSTGGSVASSTWGAVGGINGRTFTISSGPDAGKTIFLPGTGMRNSTTGSANTLHTSGYYWSATAVPSSSTNAYILRFQTSNIYPENNDNTRFAGSVRCVRTA